MSILDLDLILSRPWTSPERLLHALQHATLCRTFEAFGNFEPDPSGILPPGYVRFWGNFCDLSCVFQIDTCDDALILQIRQAIAANKARPEYLAQKTWEERKAEENRRAIALQDQRRQEARARLEAVANRA